MDPTRQPGLLEVANRHFESDYESPEAIKGLSLTSALNELRLETHVPGEWFDASIHESKKIATRIKKTLDTSEKPEPASRHKHFNIEVGITSESGSMGPDDPDLLIVTWANIEFDMTSNNIRFPEVWTMSPDAISHDAAEIEATYDSTAWDEVQFTVSRALLADRVS